MNPNTIKAIDQLLQAKKLEKEALAALLPGDMTKHLDIIGKEVKAMLLETLIALNKSDTTETQPTETSKPMSGVTKVDIG